NSSATQWLPTTEASPRLREGRETKLWLVIPAPLLVYPAVFASTWSAATWLSNAAHTHRDRLAETASRNLSTCCSSRRSRRQSTPTVCLSVSSVATTYRQTVSQVRPATTWLSCWKAVLTTSSTAQVWHVPVVRHVSLSPTVTSP